MYFWMIVFLLNAAMSVEMPYSKRLMRGQPHVAMPLLPEDQLRRCRKLWPHTHKQGLQEKRVN